MSRRTAVRFLPVLLLALAAPASAQDDACATAASITPEPTRQIQTDSPVLAPLRWGMTLGQARRALIADGWQRDTSASTSIMGYFEGQAFGRGADLIVLSNPEGRIISTTLFIPDGQTSMWSRALWDEVTGVLKDRYGAPALLEGTGMSGSATSCSAFLEGSADLQAEWETVSARIDSNCQIVVTHHGPGWPPHLQSRRLAEALEAYRTCRAEAAGVLRTPLVPGASPRRSTSPAGTVDPPPPPPPPTTISDVSPEIIGGIGRLQASIRYPSDDLQAGNQGTVYVRFVVTPEGRTADVTVVRSVSPGLDKAAMQAVSRARFTPGTQNGQRVPVLMTLPVRFALDAPPPPAAPPR